MDKKHVFGELEKIYYMMKSRIITNITQKKKY